MLALRRVVVLLPLFAVLSLSPNTDAQVKRPPPAEPTPPPSADPADVLALPTDRRAGVLLDAAKDYLDAGDWKTGIEALQRLLDRDDDVMAVLTARGPDGREIRRLVSARTEARRLLAGLPAEGRQFYQDTYGRAAAGLLARAREDKDAALLTRVAHRYALTDAGLEALQELAVGSAERGQYLLAAAQFETLLKGRPLPKWATNALAQAAIAFRRTGRTSDAVEKELFGRAGPKGLPLGDLLVTVEQMKAELEKQGKAPPRIGWPMFGGDAARAAAAPGGAPLLERTVGVPLVKDQQVIAERVKQATTALEAAGRVVMPASFPIATTVTNPRDGKPLSLVLYRSYWGIHALDVQSGKVHWMAPADWSVERMVGTAAHLATVNSWLDWYANQARLPEVLLENSTIGSLSTDGVTLFAVEDLAVPPPPPLITGLDPDAPPGINPNPNLNAALKEAVLHSRLRGYDLVSGKLKWEAGGFGKDKDKLSDSFFLGPPLPLEGRLYVLTEKAQQFRLVTLDAKTGKTLAVQPLAGVRTKLIADPLRRLEAAHLAYGDGVLVCPTNAGAVLGVDLVGGALRWAYAYRGRPEEVPAVPARPIRPGFPAPMIPTSPKWKTSAPVVRDGKVVFTAPDADAVHCLDLRDGSVVWTHRRHEDDVYFAGVGGDRVLIVGKKTVRALSLAKGETVWKLDTGLPSGRGAFDAGGLYYLPLAAAKDQKPAVAVLDVAKGVVVALARSRNEEAPGNLVFFDDLVLSQTATELVVYPQLARKIKEVDEALKANPNDPAALTERGVLRLERGDVAGAVEDLRAALANKPPKELRTRTREKLYEALTEYLKRDFKAAEKYLKEYEDLLNPDSPPDGAEAEARRRRVVYLVLLAKGREGQPGQAVAALRAYLDLADLGRSSELIDTDDPELRAAPALWVRGRLIGLLAKAEAEQTALHTEIERRAEAVRAGKDLDALRTFADVFDGTPAGRGARLLLAGRLADDKQYVEADLHLQQLRRGTDRVLAGRAVEALGRLHTQQGTLPDAVHYYRVLAGEFGDVKVRGDRTGKDLFDDLGTDKRFLPWLEERPRGDRLKIKAAVERGTFPPAGTNYHLRQDGERLPFFGDHRLVHRLDQSQVKLIGPDGTDLWTQDVTASLFPSLSAQTQPAAAFPMRTIGHLVLLPRAEFLTALDPLGKRVLWEKNLRGEGRGAGALAAAVTDPRDGTPQLVHVNDNWVQRVGRVPPSGPDAVCLQTREGLLAVHPLTGTPLWSRGGLGSRAHVWGDDRHVCVAETTADGTARGTHVFRLADGSALKVPAFAAAYNQRLRTVGAAVLVSETNRDGIALRLYDPAAGADVWKLTGPAGARVLSDADPELAGLVEPEGKVTVVATRSGKALLRADLDPKVLDRVLAVHAVADERRVYLACKGPTDRTQVLAGPTSHFLPGSGLRSVPVNGEVLAFDRATSKLRWQNTVSDQYLLLEDGRDLPVLLFASRMTTRGGPGAMPQGVQTGVTKALSKATGKLVLDDPNARDGVFHTLAVDRARGRIDLLGTAMKVSLIVEEDRPQP